MPTTTTAAASGAATSLSASRVLKTSPADLGRVDDRGQLPAGVRNMPAGSTPLLPAPSPGSLHAADEAAGLLAQTASSRAGRALGDWLVEALEQGVGLSCKREELMAALTWLQRPWGDAVTQVFGEDKAALAPYLLDQMLLRIFPDLDDPQRQRLVPLIKAHGHDASLLQWTQALALPREIDQPITLRMLQAPAEWESVQSELAARPALTQPPAAGMSAMIAPMAALATGGVIATVAPALAGLALPMAASGFLAAATVGLQQHDGSVREATENTRIEGLPTALAEQADQLLRALLPCWSESDRLQLLQCWRADPAQRTLLDIVMAIHTDLLAHNGRIDAALRALQATQQHDADATAAPPSRWAATAQSAVELALQLLPNAAIREPHGMELARRQMRAQVASPLPVPFGPASVVPMLDHARVQEHVGREAGRANLDAKMGELRNRTQRGSALRERKAQIAELDLSKARWLAPSVHRDDSIAQARRTIDQTRGMSSLEAAARAGNIRGAMQINAAAAMSQTRPATDSSDDQRSSPTLTADVDPMGAAAPQTAADAAASPGGRPASMAWLPWLASALPPALQQIGNVLPGAAETELLALQQPLHVAPAAPDVAVEIPEALVRGAGPGIAAKRPGAYTAVVALGGAAVTYGVAKALSAFWPDDPAATMHAPDSVSLQPQADVPAPLPRGPDADRNALLQAMASQVVELEDGVWGTALLLPSLPIAAALTAGEADAQTVVAGDAASTLDVREQARSLHNLAVAMVDDVAGRYGLDWLKAAADPEKALYGMALHRLTKAQDAVISLQQQTQEPDEGALRDQLADVAIAELRVAAVEAKIRGVIGPADGAPLLLDFLHHDPTIELATTHFSIAVAGGARVNATLPGYLVLRRNAPGTAAHGDVMVYQTDPASLQLFQGEQRLRDYLSVARAVEGTLAADHSAWPLAAHVLRAVPADATLAVRKALESRSQLPSGWTQAQDLRWDFAPANPNAVRDWANLLADSQLGHMTTQRQLQAQTPNGQRVAAARRTWEGEIAKLMTLHAHAHPAVEQRFAQVLRNIDPDLSRVIDPDLVELQVGGRSAPLTDWATHWWEREGLKRGVMPEGRWPSAAQLRSLSLTVWERHPDGTKSVDKDLTERLSWESNRRHFCDVLDEVATSSRLGDSYDDYLQGLKGSYQQRGLAGAQAELAEARVQLMLDRARIDGSLDVATVSNLQQAAAHQSSVRSPYQSVQVAGHSMHGLVSLREAGKDYVFVFDGPEGDRVMDADAFSTWLKYDSTAEPYIRRHAAYASHPHLAAAFQARSSAEGVPVSFASSEGLYALAMELIDQRLDDLDVLTTSRLERLEDYFEMAGTVLTVGACAVATGGTATLMCIGGSAGLFARGANAAWTAHQQGDRDAAAAAITSAVFDGVDVLEVSRLGALIFRLGHKVISTVDDARSMISALRSQRPAFTAEGQVNRAFVHSVTDLSDTPLLAGGNPADWPVYRSDGKDYVRVAGGGFVQTQTDAAGLRRLPDPQHPELPGTPVTLENGRLRVLDTAPDPVRSAPDRVRELIAEARSLDDDVLRERLAVHGVAQAQKLTAVAQADIVGRGRAAWIRGAGESGDVDRLLGTPAILTLWARSPELNGGLRVDVVAAPDRAGASLRLGTGDGALFSVTHDELDELHLSDLIERAGRGALAARMGLDPAVADGPLHAAVRQRLQAALPDAQDSMLQDWQQVAQASRHVPAAAQRLKQYYPGLSLDEADDLTRASPGLVQRAQRDEPISDVLANTVAQRHQRGSRERLLNGPLSRLDDIQTLAVMVQEHVPGSRAVIRQEGRGITLDFQRTDAAKTAERTDVLRFEDNRVSYLQGQQWVDSADWETALAAVMTPAERALSGQGSLRDSIIGQLAKHPLAAVCGATPRGRRAPCDEDLQLGMGRVRLSDGQQRVDGELRNTANQSRSNINRDLDQRLERVAATVRELLSEQRPESRTKYAVMSIPQLAGEITKESKIVGADGSLTPTAKEWRNGRLTREFRGVKKERSDFERSNLTTVNVALVVNDEEITFSRTYSSRLLKFATAENTHPAFKPQDVIVKATPKGEGTRPPDRNGNLDANDYYLLDRDREARLPGTFLFGNDVWQKEAGPGESNRFHFINPMLMTAEARRDWQTRLGPEMVKDIAVGDAYYVGTWRPCSEGKFLDDLFADLRSADPESFPKGAAPRDSSVVRGRIDLYTDAKPCDQMCKRRLKVMVSQFENVEINIGYGYDDISSAAKSRKKGEEPVLMAKFFKP